MTVVTKAMLGVLLWLLAVLPATAAGPQPGQAPQANAPTPGPAAELYRKLASVGLDAAAVHHIRDAALDREDIHITLDDGTIAFTQAVNGRITGAFFVGEGEVLLIPPNQAERGSLALFTGAAVLEEKFITAYFRFNDDTAAELQPWLRPAANPEEFLEKWGATARTLAQADALRLLAGFLNAWPAENPDHMLRARLQSTKLGIFDVYYDTLAAEQIVVDKFSFSNGVGYYDVLAAFPMRSARAAQGRPWEGAALQMAGTASVARRFHVTHYQVSAQVQPPTALEAEAILDVEVRSGGDRICFFELSRYLKVRTVEADGRPVEFLQNEALEGSDLARRGNDVVAVIFPQALRSGQRLQLRFVYGGSVLAEAGPGLLYVGERGIWFPNRGFTMADFNLEFRYPLGWTLVATGKLVSHQTVGEEQVSRWVSERPIPLAGFDLGQYRVETAKAEGAEVKVYATGSVERSFPAAVQTVTPPAEQGAYYPPGAAVVAVPAAPPAPVAQAQAVAQTAARAVDFFSQHFGPFPYGSLAVSQFPGRLSQGWPGLIFLSSYAFLSAAERVQAHLTPFESLLANQFMLVHETAHQWWGDLVIPRSYRDQWLMEALANYSAVLALEKERPADCKTLLEEYRELLLSKNKQGERVADAGPVTLGFRLSSSHFPSGYEAVSYGRGTWLLHMLREMLRDGQQPQGARGPGRGAAEEPFLRALRGLRERYQGKEVSTRDFQHALEEELPDSLRYEGKKSLDWFFEGWVNGSAIPQLKLKDVKLRRQASGMTASGLLLQEEAPAELVTSVPLYGQTADGLMFVARVFADGPHSSFQIKVPPGTRKLVLDPYETVLRRP
jgi:hypothetical protein